MNNREIKALMTELAPVVRQYVVDAVAPAVTRLEAMERRLQELECRGLKYAGIWQRASDYERGSVITHAGSAFVAIRKTQSTDKPGESDAWQMMVKAGKDGKDAR